VKILQKNTDLISIFECMQLFGNKGLGYYEKLSWLR